MKILDTQVYGANTGPSAHSHIDGFSHTIVKNCFQLDKIRNNVAIYGQQLL